MAGSQLELFHPLVAGWFAERLGAPTPVQARAWPRIAAGDNLLVGAPTGSGKTLTAFLWAVDRLLQGAWAPGGIRVLYVSPLRALNNDIQRNLTGPLQELEAIFEQAERPFVPIRAMTRSGDTPQAERRLMIRRPPEILITTPESLNILLTTRTAESLFCGLRCAILDEVHAVAGSKRGTHLITAVERLTRHAGEFQRIALSATVRPAQAIARWVAGWRDAAGDAGLERRPIRVIDGGTDKEYDIQVRIPLAAQGEGDSEKDYWERLARETAGRIAKNTSTLVFANSRRGVERLARLINAEGDRQLVYSHHGSLSRAIRQVVEERLKAGELAGIVATNSLELGIDVGAIDEVVLAQTPPSITAAVQRVGRAGHGVGQISRARLYPSHPRDVLDAAVVAAGLAQGAVEPIVPPLAPLDVLAQVVLSMTATETWHADDLFAFLARSEPYHTLTRARFDLLIEMLTGRFAGARVPSLRARLAHDRVDGSLRARPGVAGLVFLGGGTIPDRGLYTLRAADSRARIGSLDEEFVWERTPGDVFTLGVQSWRIQRITHNDVLVTPAGKEPSMAPFWRAEGRDSSSFLAERVADFLARADGQLDSVEFLAGLEQEHHLDRPAAELLVDLLRRQKAATGCPLPHTDHLVVEQVLDPQGRLERPVVILHTAWGGRLNRPFAMALAAAWQRRRGSPLEVQHDDHCVVVSPPQACRPAELLDLVEPEALEPLVVERLLRSGFFGARFRENAGRALLLPRAGFRRRTPLWLHRQRAKELLASVSRYGDFPILLETVRTCLQDEMEIEPLRVKLQALSEGKISVSTVTTSTPSPLAAEVIWKRTNELMYEDDVPESDPARIKPSLLQEVAGSSDLRPRIAPDLLEVFRRKLQRVYPGYAPGDGPELIEWVKERLLIPAGEWRELLSAVERDHGLQGPDALDGIGHRVVALQPAGREQPLVCAVEDLMRIEGGLGLVARPALLSAALDGSPASPEALAAVAALGNANSADAGIPDEDCLPSLLDQWLGLYGPIRLERVAEVWPLESGALAEALRELSDQGLVVVDRITEGESEPEICNSRNLERTLAMARAAARPVFEARPLSELPLFLASRQGLTEKSGDRAGLEQSLELLVGFPSPAASWEEEILPARLDPYHTAWLDALFAEGGLSWFGTAERVLTFCPDWGLDLLLPAGWKEEEENGGANPLPSTPGRYSLGDLVEHSGETTAVLTGRLWELAWRGEVSNDGFSAVRRGVSTGFQTPPESETSPPDGRSAPRSRFARWKTARPFPGSWFRLPRPAEPANPLELDERNRDRVRLLLDRYGVLFRELTSRELPDLRWRDLFRSLRLMEFSGEVLSGVFFEGIDGIQFAAPAAVRKLLTGLDQRALFWLNAVDPASACGLGLAGLDLPPRVSTTHLVYLGAKLILVSRRRGKRLEIRLPPDHPRLVESLGFLEVLLTRQANPMRSLLVEEIGNHPAAESSYRQAFETHFQVETSDGALRLTRRF